uniref:Endo/exonuclease/phosphatase domain-containing protein n=1 Tax=Rhabditophanes sp. KR3021 TaxID=114890 RepID=A0AC35U2M3_9BILA
MTTYFVQPKAKVLATSAGICLPYNSIFVWDSLKQKEGKDQLNEVKFSIQFKYLVGDGSEVNISMERPPNELFTAMRKRLETKLLKIKPTMKPNGGVDFNPIDEIIMEDNKATNIDVFMGPKTNYFIIDGTRYQVLKNKPGLRKLELDMVPIVGCPMIPFTEYFDYDHSIKINPLIHWFVSKKGTNVPKDFYFDRTNIQLQDWEYVEASEIFYPSFKHVGMSICCLVDLGPDTIQSAVSTRNNVVLDRPSQMLSDEIREPFCQDHLKAGHRILNFNILADLYLNLKVPQEDLYFSHCPKEFQISDYRYPLLLREIIGYDADLMCLQEVDNKFQSKYLMNYLDKAKYGAVFGIKGGKVNEGVVIGWKKNKYDLKQLENVLLVGLLELDKFPENKDVCDYLEKDQEIKEKFLSRPTVLLVALLECIGELDKFGKAKKVLVATTHLHFDPRHEHVKAMQCLLCWRYIERIRKDMGDEDISVIFAGDFNVTPEGGAVQLSLKGTTELDEECWNCTPSMGGAVFKISNKYKSLCEFPEYTNYTLAHNKKKDKIEGFAGTLDYIWGDSTVKVNRIANMPRHESVTKHGALPAKHSPSDHLPLLCEIDFYK